MYFQGLTERTEYDAYTFTYGDLQNFFIVCFSLQICFEISKLLKTTTQLRQTEKKSTLFPLSRENIMACIWPWTYFAIHPPISREAEGVSEIKKMFYII